LSPRPLTGQSCANKRTEQYLSVDVFICCIAASQIVACDKNQHEYFWLKDKSLADLDNLRKPDELANEIIQNLETELSCFRAIAAAL
jgi:hypothetical protein